MQTKRKLKASILVIVGLILIIFRQEVFTAVGSSASPFIDKHITNDSLAFLAYLLTMFSFPLIMLVAVIMVISGAYLLFTRDKKKKEVLK